MKWNAVQTELKKAGYLTFAMDQGQTDVLTMPGPWGMVKTTHGYCAGLAMHWIALRLLHRDFKYDKTTLVCETPSWKSTKAHNQMSDSWDGDPITSIAMPLSAYGLTLNLGQRYEFRRPLKGRDLRKVGAAADACYYIYLSGSAGAHAVAMQRRAGHDWRFFDANYGEFKIPGRLDFEGVMDWFLAATDYTTDFAALNMICGINSPPYVNAKALDASTA